jgi:Tfp pilus assembly protein PilF
MIGSSTTKAIIALSALALVGLAGCDKNKEKPRTPDDEAGAPAPETETGGSGGVSGFEETGGVDETGGEIEEDMTIPEPPAESVDDESKQLGAQHVAEGLMAVGSGNETKAKTAFEKALSVDSGSFQAAYNLGALAEQEGDLTLAKKYYKQALSANPEYGPAVKAFAYLVARSGSLKSALDFAKQKHEKYATNPDIATAYAELLVMSGKNDKAISVAKQALQEDESNVAAMIALARAYLARDQHEFAGFILDMAEKNDAANPSIYYIRGVIYEKNEYEYGATEMYEKAIELKPDFVEALNRLAVIQINGGSFDEAAANLEKVVALAPELPEAHLNLGEAYRGMREWEKAHQHLTRAEQEGADEVAVALNLAFLYFAADTLPGLNRIQILEKARTRFLEFRDLVGAKAASEKVDIDLILKQIDKMIRIQKKLAEKKKQQAEEAEGG